MLEVAKKNEWIKGVVGWLPLMDSELSKKILNEKYILNKFFNIS